MAEHPRADQPGRSTKNDTTDIDPTIPPQRAQADVQKAMANTVKRAYRVSRFWGYNPAWHEMAGPVLHLCPLEVSVLSAWAVLALLRSLPGSAVHR